MSSGVILGYCPVCEWAIHEDEWSGGVYEKYERFVHAGKCASLYRNNGPVYLENERLRAEIIELKSIIRALKQRL